ncbi:hypothetical protein AY601_1996 [Pedobacter cryoconitis]|uniref:GmrSD restriction endonucleases N-terminal domain-containing protein n=1 Tax=Pedobacter cryoconitis TaxID=188932 RepID=A0A127VBX6_9SPHI|nr:DUF262 domain-containing protein [Pedobacter cryoconitis]AMP98902.1 hypothetical protein AY601_1996 [Pedobacter cryoconitis]
MPSIQQELTVLGSKTFNLKELFTNNYFIIPDYQRGYSWETEHLEDLTKDILNITKIDGKHYTGTIVAAINESTSNTYELVDGQQRLTTLIIFLNEIYHYDPDLFKDIYPIFISRGTKGNERNVLTPNIETRKCFQYAIIQHQDFNAETKSHESIINASKYFKEFLRKDDVDPSVIYNTILTKLNFLFFTPEQNREIGIMFEVINNRGKQLSELEKIKNFFIYYATVHSRERLRKEINLRWSDIQISLSKAHRTSNDDENAFLRYCFIVFFKTSKDKSWYVYDECKELFNVKDCNEDYIDNAVDRMRDFVEFVALSAKHYSWFFNGDQFDIVYNGEIKTELTRCLTYLRSQPTYASIMPLYLSIMSRLDIPHQVVRLLNLLEVVNMRLYVLPDIFRRADSKQADMFEFAWEFFNDRNWNSENDPAITYYNQVAIKGDVFEWLFENLVQITDAFCPENRFIDNLELDYGESFNYYRWIGIRYFLSCYEEHIRSQKAKRSFEWKRLLTGKKNIGHNKNDQLSIEHIWASKNMEVEFPSDFHTKRRLGNFVLCGLSSNISLSNKNIPGKIAQLEELNGAGEGALDMIQVAELSKIFRLVDNEMTQRRKTKNYWREMADKICEQREEVFKKFALERWKLPNEKTTVINV